MKHIKPILITVGLATMLSGVALGQTAVSILKRVQKLESERVGSLSREQGYISTESMSGSVATLFHGPVWSEEHRLPVLRIYTHDEVVTAFTELKNWPPGQTKRLLVDTYDGTKALYKGFYEETGIPIRQIDDKYVCYLRGLGYLAKKMPTTEEFHEEQRRRDESAVNEYLMPDFINAAKLEGTEMVGGRNAFHLSAKDFRRTVRTWNVTLVLTSVDLWIDSGKYVPVHLKLAGQLTKEGKTSDVIIERIDSDYRPVGPLYVPFKRVLRIGGAADDSQMEDFKEAQQRMKEALAKIENLPPAQKKAIKERMQPQIEQMKKMSGGTVESVTTVLSARVGTVLDYLNTLETMMKRSS